ncbi:MAG: type II toxin-antitoxin system HicA family toxin [Chloroflexi bacterium]|nr:type II toxin-antitoxin system HicA family toxin [Chloroflexota bacterium]
MPVLGPISRRDLIRNLRRLGFDGPFPGGKHEIMQREDVTVILPNPHGAAIGRNLLVRVLRRAGVDRDTWEKL